MTRLAGVGRLAPSTIAADHVDRRPRVSHAEIATASQEFPLAPKVGRQFRNITNNSDADKRVD